ncbi:MAG: hypothetical protein DYG96_09930 [Chlorobi bacterium CHB2]|nr:hypothetical protein [Chlorobi bacterium CHB2]
MFGLVNVGLAGASFRGGLARNPPAEFLAAPTCARIPKIQAGGGNQMPQSDTLPDRFSFG